MKKRKVFLQLLLSALVVLVALCGPCLFGQVDTGSVQGTITDQSGAVIPNAKVSLTNEGTNFTMSTTTGGDAHFVVGVVLHAQAPQAQLRIVLDNGSLKLGRNECGKLRERHCVL